MSEFINKFKKSMENMPLEESVLVGFSGGADSTALLHLLGKYTEERGIRLSALHVNHMIRGAEADRDEEFCREFCQKRGIEFFSVKADVPAIAKKEKKGIEECARDLRYSAFEKICREHNIKYIATAHNADDNLESMIFNLARGSASLCGIAPVRGNIIRPLLEFTKEEITEYLECQGIEYVYDSSNSSVDYTRNYIRHNIIPHVKHLNPEASRASVSCARAQRADREFILSSAQGYKGDIMSAPRALKTRLIAMEYERAGGRPSALYGVHYDMVAELMEKNQSGSAVSLPGKIAAKIIKGRLTFVPDTREKKEKDRGIYPLKVGVTEIPELDLAVEIIPISEKSKISEKVYKLSMKARLSFDTIEDINSLYCRARSEGDAYRVRGMTKTVKKLLSERELDAEEKLNYPVVCDKDGIVFLAGFDKRDGSYTEGIFKYAVNVYLFKN